MGRGRGAARSNPGRWAQLADPDFDFADSFKRYTDGFHVPTNLSKSVRGSRTGEPLARCVVETGTSSQCTIRRATTEPVLAELCRRIAADELRHYRTLYELSKQYLQNVRIGLSERVRVVAGRVLETEDEELAHAYPAANGKQGPFDDRRNTLAYTRRAYALNPPHLVDRIVAMLFKVVGLRPHGWLNRTLARLAHRLMRCRANRLATQGAWRSLGGAGGARPQPCLRRNHANFAHV